MNKPRILLSGNRKLQNYINAVEGTGGIAVAGYLPPVNTDFDGLILCGGNDIDPARYGETVAGSVDIDHARDAAEFSLLEAFVNAGKPVMGICRGHQLINVFFGGSLYQDIPTARAHSSYSDFDLVHRVGAEAGSIAGRLYGAEFSVNSYHHQAVKELGRGLRVTMRASDDAVIEGFEHEVYPIFGVQWHPERLCMGARRADAVDGAPLFAHFLKICGK